MSDRRTDEQRAADDRLTAAIADVVAAYGFAQPGTLISEHLTIVSTLEPDDKTGYLTLVSGGSMPDHHMLGLLDKGQELYDQQDAEDS